MKSITQTQVNDFEAGKRDRLAGYYDKWYRYNRLDDGAAYDAGCVHVVSTARGLPDCQIIECKRNDMVY